jgi:transposase InsO family protein
MVTSLPRISFSDGVCSGCALGKHPEDSSTKGRLGGLQKSLSWFHNDVVGPFPSLSFNKAHYLLTFIDDFSRYTWVYFLQQKGEAFDRFQEFKAHAEKQSGKCIKILCTDNGREYVNHRFEQFCTLEGIYLQHTVTYTPQQNGVAERKNRSERPHD